MLKKSLLVLSIICLILITGCELGQQQTILIVKNSGSSDSNIRIMSITQYVGSREDGRSLNNALSGLDQIEPGESQSFEIAPYTTATHPLEIDVLFVDDTSQACNVTYAAESTFTLICDNTAAPDIFSIEGDGAALVYLD